MSIDIQNELEKIAAIDKEFAEIDAQYTDEEQQDDSTIYDYVMDLAQDRARACRNIAVALGYIVVKDEYHHYLVSNQSVSDLISKLYNL